MTRLQRFFSLTCALGITTCLMAGSAPAQEDSSSQATIVTVEGRQISGSFQSLDGSALTVAGSDDSQEIPRTSLLRMTTDRSSTTGEQPFVLLGNGDVITGSIVDIADEVVRVDNAFGSGRQLKIPLEYVASLVLALPKEELERQRLQRLWTLTRADKDRLLYMNGTYSDGELSAVNTETISMTSTVGPLESKRADVAAVVMNADLMSEFDAVSDHVIVQTVAGTRLSITGASSADGQFLEGRTLWDAVVRIPVADLSRIDFFHERVQPLSALEPTEYVFTPYLTESHPLVRNRNVHGGPLVLRGVIYSHGLGMHSQSEVTYDLTQTDARLFQTTLGIDDMAEKKGSAVFTVELDGQAVFQSGEVTGADDPISIGPLDVSNAKTLTLKVDFGALGNIRDIADWGDAVLIK